MNALLDMKHLSQRPVHKDELRHLAYIVSTLTQREARAASTSSVVTKDGSADERKTPVDGASADDDDDDNDTVIEISSLPPLALEVEKLILKITNKTSSDPEIWDIFADFYANVGRHRSVIDCRVKEVSVYLWLLY
jgi:hypothetical protein